MCVKNIAGRRRIGLLGILVVLLMLGCTLVTLIFCRADIMTWNSGDFLPHIEDVESKPAIPRGNSVDWDQHIGEIGNVLYEPKDVGYEYKLFYSGYRGDYMQDNVYIGFAFSSDGESWSKYGQILSHPSEDPYIVKVNDTYYLYAEDKADTPFRNIRRWHSSDCRRWVDDGVVLEPRFWSLWESQDVSSPVVWTEDNVWFMLYEGRGGGPHNVLGPPSRLWGYLSRTWVNTGGKIGLATSTNGVDWTRSKSNPVFIGSGKDKTFDRNQVVPDDILNVDSTYYLTYHAHSGSDWNCGVAKSSDLISWAHATEPMSNFPTNVMLLCNGQQCTAFYFNCPFGICRGYIGLK